MNGWGLTRLIASALLAAGVRSEQQDTDFGWVSSVVHQASSSAPRRIFTPETLKPLTGDCAGDSACRVPTVQLHQAWVNTLATKLGKP